MAQSSTIMDQKTIDTSQIDLEQLKIKVAGLAETLTTSTREIIRHFQVLKSARASRLMMDAPGLYFPALPLIVISKAGAHRGHTQMHDLITPHLPAESLACYGFVLYPESYVRSCLDSILRRTVKPVCPEMRVSIENNFNHKHHGKQDFTASPILLELVSLMRKDLGLQP